MQTRKLELLAPAKNLECGKEAINHGADAVYIGAAKYGARAAAGNSIDDIAELCEYAHRYEACVYVTVNTIIYDEEMEDTIDMVRQLSDIGVDAILLQDMGLLREIRRRDIDMRIHASTQVDSRTTEKVKWLAEMGVKRVVLARELSIMEIETIHKAAPEVELEVFVHGALCVSYSGQCYASEHCFGRSANRGECSQFCRMTFDLIDDASRHIIDGKHLLSLKDMSQLENMKRLADAGAISFKIEGRLKDADYVKNVTAAYSQALNRVCEESNGLYERASLGKCEYTFEPDIRKSFNRGFTTYFADGRQEAMASFDTPKALGEYVGKVKEIRGGSFNVSTTAAFANGDGLCFLDDKRNLVGFRVNKAEGNRLYPLTMPRELRPGTMLYRNHDQAFVATLSKATSIRKIEVDITLEIAQDRLTMTMTDERGNRLTSSCEYAYSPAQKPQEDNIKKQLTKLGNTVYVCRRFMLDSKVEQPFIANSLLAELRRQCTEKAVRQAQVFANGLNEPTATKWQYDLPYLYNASNAEAKAFYKDLNANAKALETDGADGGETLIMQCRYCLRNEMGYCTKSGRRAPWTEPLRLRLSDGREFRLNFNCRKCEMEIFA